MHGPPVRGPPRRGAALVRVGRLLLGMLLLATPARSDTVRVAVAANFADALKQLAQEFRAERGHQVSVSVGSPGKLHAQIIHGAPFDLFFAADVRRPELLEEAGLVVDGTRVIYATGRLALWVPELDELPDPSGWLRAQGFRYLALANPRLAPYGRAARQVLEGLQLWGPLQPRLVRGENIGQAFQFVSSGAAQGGLVALSQLRKPGSPAAGAAWVVPAGSHDPVEQQVVLLADRSAPREFLDFVLGPTGRRIMGAYGYSSPGPETGSQE